jgi:Uma2 family endonuclease
MAMVQVPEHGLWTVADLDALPEGDGNRYEILYGELLVTPSPSHRHQAVATELTVSLANWLRATGIGAIRSPGVTALSPTTQLIPDLAVYPIARDDTRPWNELPPALLVVEVLSKSTRARDRSRKRPAYFAFGVGAVWTIDAKACLVEVWVPGADLPVVVRDVLRWQPVVDGPVFELPLVELFGSR